MFFQKISKGLRICFIGDPKYSDNLIGFIKSGHSRKGENVRAVDLVRDNDVEVEICSPHFVDPEGERLRV